MMICKAIATGDELAWIKNLQKLKAMSDEVAMRDVQLFDGVEFTTINQLVILNDMKAALNEAIQFAIQNKK